MNLSQVEIVFQLISFLFAISIHESAHAWMANRCGDPTARMLGRITLNPIRHIDPVGTILLPAIAAYTHIPMLGWAKPTPVNPNNFRNPVRDDILTSVAGPVSNFIVATGTLILLGLVSLTSTMGHNLVANIRRYQQGFLVVPDSPLVPLVFFLYAMMTINIVLGVFNLIPVPPLDGSHVLRHFLSDSARRAYDTIGIFGLIALIYLGGGLLQALISPPLKFFTWILTRF
jgi:Zn-dependent protease